mmetsp:Transcript_17221/g.25838  ORF Transcript_17221/g.25838 Transcript_17221/m.25838 type:complete len:171 (-) Transcript_17221:1235-1747(-)
MSEITLNQAIVMLQGMFPNMSTDVITMVLKSQNLSVDATISALLEMQKAALAAAAPKKSRLPSSYKKMEKYKMQLKQAVKEEKYRQAADIKEAIAELEKVINLDIADGHKVETLSVSINKDAKGKSGFDFKYHAYVLIFEILCVKHWIYVWLRLVYCMLYLFLIPSFSST